MAAPRSRRERYLRPCGSTIVAVVATSEALALESSSRVEISSTKVQRGPRRTVFVNEHEPRVGPPVSTKSTSPTQAMKYHRSKQNETEEETGPVLEADTGGGYLSTVRTQGPVQT
jgi:hypothetical protein